MYKSWKIRLEPLSPFLIGGHRIIDNHYESLDYIPGHVLQAAFARAILESHADYDVSDHEKKYYIKSDSSTITASGCKKEWVHWFEYFSELAFSDAVPLGKNKYTPTSFRCKNDEDHPIVETLPERYTNRKKVGQPIKDFYCNVCGGRLERKGGWMFADDERVIKRLVARNALDSKTLTSKDEQLFSMSIGEKYSHVDLAGQRTKKLYFEAVVYAPEEAEHLEAATDEIVRVGAYITTGLGKMRITVMPMAPMTDGGIEETIDKWRKEVKDDSIAVQVLSDVPLALDSERGGSYLETDDYLQLYTDWLIETSTLPASAHVAFAYLQTYEKRGFVTGSNEYREATLKRFIENGGVFIFKAEDDKMPELESWVKRIVREGMPIVGQDRPIRIPVKLL